MKTYAGLLYSIRLLALPIFILFIPIREAAAQAESPIPAKASSPLENGLFDSEEVLHITLRGNMKKLLKSRSDDPKKYPLVLSYFREDSSEISIPVEVKQRGHFRRLYGNCSYPPLMIRFPGSEGQLNSIFRNQKKTKLVMPCQSDDYVVREWLVYKLYQLITPVSFNARLVLVQLDDERKKKRKPFYGILLEEEDQMADRNQMAAIKQKMSPKETHSDAFLTMAVFEYLIGNTDWSVQYLQNIKLLVPDSTADPVSVPYDFDHAGIVNTPYALPAAELKMSSVQERRFRGYCIRDMRVFEPVLAHFNQIKDEIYKTYTTCTHIDAKYLKSTTAYLDVFYETINNPEAWQQEFAYPCDPKGTGNVVIQGLKKNE